MKTLRPYFTAFRIRALLETQYRGAAIGGMATQFFFGAVYVCLYQAFYASGGEQSLLFADMVTYVWLQQLFFRAMVSADAELNEQIMTGAVAYTLCRPVDQYTYWLSRSLAQKLVGSLMRAIPMLALMLLLPREMRMSLPQSVTAFAQFLFSMLLGVGIIAEIDAIRSAFTMRSLDPRGISAMLQLLMMILAGNVIPLPFFPDRVQALIRYQPFAQALDAPIRMYLGAQPPAEWLVNVGVQLLWLCVLLAVGRLMWRHRLADMTVQGG